MLSQVPCVGFSIGVERVLSILEAKAKVVSKHDVLVAGYDNVPPSYSSSTRLAQWVL